jgi:hypothetical protein
MPRNTLFLALFTSFPAGDDQEKEGSSGERREGIQAETRGLRAERDKECPQLRSNTNLECTMLIISHALQLSRNSLTSSYVKNDVAMLGATFTAQSVNPVQHAKARYAHKLGHSPRYIPRTPSVLIITRAASSAPLYWYPSASAPSPITCIFRRITSNGYVSVCDIDPFCHIKLAL